ESLARLKLRSLGDRTLPVPGTNILADVAAEHMASDTIAHPLRDRSPFFDGEIRDALVGIELVRSKKRVCWASVQTTRASSTPIWGRQIGCQLQRGQNHSKEQPRPLRLIENAGILADPSHSGVLGVNAFDERSGIDVAPRKQLCALAGILLLFLFQ